MPRQKANNIIRMFCVAESRLLQISSALQGITNEISYT